MGSLPLRLKLWAKRWLLWHYPCPVHGVQYTYKTIDPDSSWDGGMLTYCDFCGMSCIEVERWLSNGFWA